MPRWRMRAMIASRSGCMSGSPPLMVTAEVPSPARRSTRRSITSRGTGADTESYSLQYRQARLHRRMGIMWTRTGWCLSRTAQAILAATRARRRARMSRFMSRSTGA